MKARLKNQHTVQIGAKIYNYLNVNKRQSSIFPQQAIVSCGDKINPDPFHYPKFQPQRKLIVTAYDSFFTIQCHKRTGFQNLCCIFCPDQYRKIKAQSSNRPMAIRTIIFNDQTGCQTDLFHHLIGSISGNNDVTLFKFLF